MNMFSSFYSKKENDLDGNTFKKQVDGRENAILIDVRTRSEYNNGTIPGAINIDFMGPDCEQKILELDKNKVYYLFCMSGNRSALAVSQLEEAGFKSFNLIGGIAAWPG